MVQGSRAGRLTSVRQKKPLSKSRRDSLLAPAEENLSHVLARVDANPQITFTFYLPPASILFWDKTDRNGEIEATLTMQQKVLEELTSRPNTRVFYFMDDLDLITSLDNYCDHVHYSPAVCQELAHRILQDQPMTQEEIAPRIAGVPRIFAKL